MEFVKNLPYELKNGGTSSFGTDIEFATLGGRHYALAGSYMNGMQIVDITNPRDSRIVGVFDCGVTQGDIQVFRQASKPGRTFVAYASDTFGDGTSTCYQEAAALGFEVKKSNGTAATAPSLPRSRTRSTPRPSRSSTSPRARTTRPCTRAGTTSTTRTPT